MTIEDAQKFIDALIYLRNSATDVQALSASAAYPRWKSGQMYYIGDRVVYEDVLYRVLTSHTSQSDWTPSSAPSLFAKVLIVDETVIPEWQQPDSTNPYMSGDKVTYSGKTWKSDIDNNVWAPGVYGWTEC